MKQRTKGMRILIVFGIITVIITYGYLTVHFHMGLPCLLYTFTGWYCPGCGLGRSVRCILEGQWYQAFRYNVLLMPFIIPGGLLLLYTAWQYIQGTPYRNYWIIRLFERAGIPIAIIMLLYGILRNFELFSILAPVSLPN